MIGPQDAVIPRGDVYWNLHRRIWSVKDRDAGRVTYHARAVVAPHAGVFHVSEAGRARTIRTGWKQVHAYVRAPAMRATDDAKHWRDFVRSEPAYRRVGYNPTRGPHFHDVETGEDVHAFECCVMLAPSDAPPTVWAILSA